MRERFEGIKRKLKSTQEKPERMDEGYERMKGGEGGARGFNGNQGFLEEFLHRCDKVTGFYII